MIKVIGESQNPGEQKVLKEPEKNSKVNKNNRKTIMVENEKLNRSEKVLIRESNSHRTK